LLALVLSINGLNIPGCTHRNKIILDFAFEFFTLAIFMARFVYLLSYHSRQRTPLSAIKSSTELCPLDILKTINQGKTFRMAILGGALFSLPFKPQAFKAVYT